MLSSQEANVTLNYSRINKQIFIATFPSVFPFILDADISIINSVNHAYLYLSDKILTIKIENFRLEINKAYVTAAVVVSETSFGCVMNCFHLE